MDLPEWTYPNGVGILIFFSFAILHISVNNLIQTFLRLSSVGKLGKNGYNLAISNDPHDNPLVCLRRSSYSFGS